MEVQSVCVITLSCYHQNRCLKLKVVFGMNEMAFHMQKQFFPRKKSEHTSRRKNCKVARNAAVLRMYLPTPLPGGGFCATTPLVTRYRKVFPAGIPASKSQWGVTAGEAWKLKCKAKWNECVCNFLLSCKFAVVGIYWINVLWKRSHACQRKLSLSSSRFDDSVTRGSQKGEWRWAWIPLRFTEVSFARKPPALFDWEMNRRENWENKMNIFNGARKKFNKFHLVPLSSLVWSRTSRAFCIKYKSFWWVILTQWFNDWSKRNVWIKDSCFTNLINTFFQQIFVKL